MSDQNRAPRFPKKVVALAALLVISLLVCGVAIYQGWIRPDTLRNLVARTGPWGMLTFVVLVPIAEFIWIPRAWGLLAAGLLFGPVLGGALSMVGDTAGALACYLLARGWGREWVASMLQRRRRTEQVVRMLAHKRGALMVALLRVCPLAHYTLVSYAAGLTGVSVRSFVLGNSLGLIPGAVVYSLAGSALLTPTSPLFLSMAALTLLAVVVTTLVARRMVRGEMARGGHLKKEL